MRIWKTPRSTCREATSGYARFRLDVAGRPATQPAGPRTDCRYRQSAPAQPGQYWELAIKVSLGKYQLAEPLDEFVNREVRKNGVTILPIQPAHAAQVADLPFHHRDPFDRLFIAQAMVEQAALVSKDAVFESYGVQRQW